MVVDIADPFPAVQKSSPLKETVLHEILKTKTLRLPHTRLLAYLLHPLVLVLLLVVLVLVLEFVLFAFLFVRVHILLIFLPLLFLLLFLLLVPVLSYKV